MELFDTHCHIHEIVADQTLNTETQNKYHKAGISDPTPAIAEAKHAGVTKLLCVGTTLADSKLAIDFVKNRQDMWASIGIHPHEAKDYVNDTEALEAFANLATEPKVVAVGECGLDYFYTHSTKRDQEKILRFQIELALKQDLPMIFHIRDAFADFWPIFDSYKRIRGVVHSFTATELELQQILKRGLYVGINGIATFMKDDAQLNAIKNVPLDRLVLETDAPFLTPYPYRGTICAPKHLRVTAEFLAGLRGEPIDLLATNTTQNALKVFHINERSIANHANEHHSTTRTLPS